MMWSVAQYTIHAIDERYISAHSASQRGGEIWVLNRATGEYVRATVGISWASPQAIERNDPGKLSGSTYSGKCSRRLL